MKSKKYKLNLSIRLIIKRRELMKKKVAYNFEIVRKFGCDTLIIRSIFIVKLSYYI